MTAIATTNEPTGLATLEKDTALVSAQLNSPFAPRNHGELVAFCEAITKTNLCPGPYRGKPMEAAAAIMHGFELGLPVMQALQSVCVIHGQTTVYGVTAMALVRGQPLWDEHKYIEYFELDTEQVTPGELGEAENWPNNLTAVCVMGRRDGNPHYGRFSVGQAKDADLWQRTSGEGKKMPWAQYPADMLMWKARSRAIKLAFPNVLKGLQISQDIGSGRVIDVTPEELAPAKKASEEGQPNKGTAQLKDKVSKGKAKKQAEPKPKAEKPENLPAPEASAEEMDKCRSLLENADRQAALDEGKTYALQIYQAGRMSDAQLEELKGVYKKRLAANLPPF